MSFLLPAGCAVRATSTSSATAARSRAAGARTPIGRRGRSTCYRARTSTACERAWWFHRTGCRRWFQAERDTRDNRVIDSRGRAGRRPAGPGGAAATTGIAPASAGAAEPGRRRWLRTGGRVARRRPSEAAGPDDPVHLRRPTPRGRDGDTIASALAADGVDVLAHSFKYHRPRGILCADGRCPNCLVDVDGQPNVRACVDARSARACGSGRRTPGRRMRRRPARAHGPLRSPAAGRLLLQDVHPAASSCGRSTRGSSGTPQASARWTRRATPTSDSAGGTSTPTWP